MSNYENAVLQGTIVEINKCKDTDSVNKMYRQARIWCRFHHFVSHGAGCDYETYRELISIIKGARYAKFRELELNRTSNDEEVIDS